MKAAIYLGWERVEVRELPDPVCGGNDVVLQNIYSSICGTAAPSRAFNVTIKF